MHDRPTAQELTESVSHFLQHEVAPAITDPRLRFRVLIAANLMAIVTRELAVGDEPARREWHELAALLERVGDPPTDGESLLAGGDGMRRELCARIRRGDGDDGPWAEAVRAHVEAAVIARLKIANPRFLERVAAGG